MSQLAHLTLSAPSGGLRASIGRSTIGQRRCRTRWVNRLGLCARVDRRSWDSIHVKARFG